MKTKIITSFTCLLFLSLLVNNRTYSQQSNYPALAHSTSQKMTGNPPESNYTYHLFIAPNKVFGYDIFQNGKIIFHQPAAAEPAGTAKTGLTKKPFAEQAAMMAIEKIKKGVSPELSRQEILKIASQ